MINYFPYNDDKALNVFLYIANRLVTPDIYRVFKILYLADVEHLAKYGRPIVGDVYHALPKGPVPTNMYDEFKLVASSSKLAALFHKAERNKLLEAYEAKGYTIVPKVDADLDELSQSDIECLDKSIAENKDLTFGQIKNKSHDAAYDKASENGPIGFDEIAKVGGADEAMVNYIHEANLYSLYKPK